MGSGQQLDEEGDCMPRDSVRVIVGQAGFVRSVIGFAYLVEGDWIGMWRGFLGGELLSATVSWRGRQFSGSVDGDGLGLHHRFRKISGIRSTAWTSGWKLWSVVLLCLGLFLNTESRPSDGHIR